MEDDVIAAHLSFKIMVYGNIILHVTIEKEGLGALRHLYPLGESLRI